MRVGIRLLGGFGVVVDGRALPDEVWHRRAAASLVKLLALHPERRLRREQVIDALWPDLLVDDAAPRLHKAAHYARTALGDRGSLVLAAETVTLLPGAEVTVDVADFEQASDVARAEGTAESAAAAADRYRGDLLPDDIYEPWTEERRDALRVRYLELLRAAGRWEQALAVDPLDEQAWLDGVGHHLREGRRQPALALLDRMEEVFQRELGTGAGAAAEAFRRKTLALPVLTPDGAARRRATPIPRPPTTTVGREEDLRRVLALLARSRIVTVLGPGGVGKTRLAVEAALRAGSEACFVDLTRVSDPALVAELIGREIGIHVGSAATAERALTEALPDRPLLLLLDNFEHVVDAAGLVGRLVAAAPRLRVLVTSRIRMNLAGEQLYDVDPLPVDAGVGDAPVAPAVALFTQVARAVDPDFDPARQMADVVAICEQVDGLPLAIELAAGHVRTLSPALLRARLAARLRSPSAGARDRHPRQQTVQATIDWSLQLLGPAERRLFTRLGVFAGAVPLEAVEAVCADEDADVIDPLSRLVDQSLVRRTADISGEPRFGLLELLRERARELLADEPDSADLRARHARWVAELAESHQLRRWTDSGGPWLARVEELLPEIRAAQEWARRHDRPTAARITASMGPYWHRAGLHTEGRAWVADALRDAEALPDELLRGRLHLTAGFVEWTRDVAVGRAHWEAAAGAFRDVGHDRFLACALAWSSVTLVGDPDRYADAMRRSDEAVALARTVEEPALLVQALNNRGELARVHGEHDRAQAAYEEALAVAEDNGDDIAVLVLHANLGLLSAARGDMPEAGRLLRQALRLAAPRGRRMMAAWFVCQLADPELGLERPRVAARLVGAGERALHRLGTSLYPSDRIRHEQILQALREALGATEFERLRAEGERMSLDEAIDLALREPASLPPPRSGESEELIRADS